MKLALAILVATTGSAAADEPTWIQPADTLARIATALEHPDAKAPRELLIDETTAQVDVAKLRADLLADKHLRVVQEVPGGAFVVEHAATHARILVAIGADRGRLVLTPHPSPSPAAPGACVAIPHPAAVALVVHAHGIDDRGEYHESEIHWSIGAFYAGDVDGDGVIDAFVPEPLAPAACPEDVGYRVFAVRGTCGHDLGVLVAAGSTFEIGVPGASGFAPITATSERSRQVTSPIPEMVTTTCTYAFAHGAYAKTTETSRSGVCHHCNVWSCSH